MTVERRLPAVLAPLRAAPTESAILLDVDGTLAPIVDRPELACVPERARAAIERLVDGYRLVACVSGRPGAEAARLVGAEGVRYVGNHGLELHPDADSAREDIAAFRQAIEHRWPVEDKGLSLSLHFRQEPDEQRARSVLDELAAQAERRGLDARWGRKVLEIRPPIRADKGTAVAELLGESGATRAMYAGDDTTDLDAFRALEEGGLAHRARLAVDSPEAPAELLAAADLVVSGTEELTELLERLTLD